MLEPSLRNSCVYLLGVAFLASRLGTNGSDQSHRKTLTNAGHDVKSGIENNYWLNFCLLGMKNSTQKLQIQACYLRITIQHWNHRTQSLGLKMQVKI